MATTAIAQSWTILPSIKNPRFESSTIQYRDDLYVFNGFDRWLQIETAVEKFDAATKTWSVIGNTSLALGNAFTHNGFVLDGNEVWFLGGRVGAHPGAVTSKVWKFNLTTNQWSQGPPLPVPVAAGGAALVDNHIHWFGGLDPNAQCDVSNHYVYDLDNPTAGWADISGIAPMPVPRNHFATVVHEGLIYAIGGQFTHDGCGQGTPDSNLVHVFDPQTNTWTQVASLPAVQSHIEPSSFEYKGAIYVVGGETSGNKVFRYDPSNDIWDTVAELPQPLIAPVAKVVDDQLIVSSGRTPAKLPSLLTYATDMTPLLLPGAEDTNTNSDPSTGIAGDAGLVSLEAEYYDTQSGTETHQWVSVDLTGASQNGAMTTPDNNKLTSSAEGSPSMAYFAYFDRPGTWYLWVRGWGDTAVNGQGFNDSLHAGLNGTLSATADKIDNFPPGWNWSNSTRDSVRASINIPSAGIHAVNLWMREDGLAVDKILLTTDANYQPDGIVNVPSDNSTIADNQEPPDSDGDNGDTDSNNNTSTDEVDIVDEVTTDTTAGTTDPDSTTDTPNNPTDTGIVSLEAEDYDNQTATGTHQWVSVDLAGASNNGAMTTPDKSKLTSSAAGSPSMAYSANFDRSGTWYLWVRGWGDTAVNGQGYNDSLHAGLNGTLSATADKIDNFPPGWNWSNRTRDGVRASINIPSAGMHTVNLWMREDGLAVDKILLTTDANYQPDGIVNVPSDNATDADSQEPTDGDNGDTDSNNNTTDPDSTTDTPSNPTETGIVSLEAEDYDNQTATGTHQWVSVDLAGASNNGAMTTPDKSKLTSSAAGSPSMAYSANFDRSGTWYLWVRGWGDTAVNGQGFNDSLHAGLNGTLSATADKIDNFPPGWNWSNSTRDGVRASINIPSAGMHTVNLWMREDGLAVDKILLTTDANYHPDGIVNAPSDNETDADSQEPDSVSDGTDIRLDANRSWEQLSLVSRPSKRLELGAVAVDGKIYAMGGMIHRRAEVNNVEVFDPQANTWTHVSNTPLGINHFQPVAYDGKIYIIGALQSRGFPYEGAVPRIHIYNTRTNAWSLGPVIPSDRVRGAAGAVIYKNKIYIVGGNTAGHATGAVDWFDEFDPATGAWKRLAPLPNARDHITVAIAGDRLVVAAGRRSANPNPSVHIGATDIYRFDTGEWITTADDIPTKRSGIMAVAVGDEVVIIGGESVGPRTHGQVEAINSFTGKWRSLQNLQVPRHAGGATVLDNKIHVISGDKNSGISEQTDSHEILRFD